MTDRLGPFEADQTKPQPARQRYTPKPRQPHPSSAGLFAEYQRERQGNTAARRQGLSTIKAETAARKEALRKWSATQRTIIKVGMKGPARKLANAAMRTQIAAQRATIAKDAAGRRAGLASGASLPNWNEWLVARAEGGDVEALAVLRSRAERVEKMRGDLLTAASADKAKIVILDSLKAVARKDGAMNRPGTAGGHLV